MFLFEDRKIYWYAMRHISCKSNMISNMQIKYDRNDDDDRNSHFEILLN